MKTIRPVTIVAVDEGSLREIGQWPWPRTTMAELVTRVTDLGAAIIGFDVVFSEPDTLSPARLANSLQGLDVETRSKLAALPSSAQTVAVATLYLPHNAAPDHATVAKNRSE